MRIPYSLIQRLEECKEKFKVDFEEIIHFMVA